MGCRLRSLFLPDSRRVILPRRVRDQVAAVRGWRLICHVPVAFRYCLARRTSITPDIRAVNTAAVIHCPPWVPQEREPVAAVQPDPRDDLMPVGGQVSS